MGGGIEAPWDGAAVKAWRLARGLTRQQAAALFGVGPRGLDRVEAGAHQPSPQMRLLARYFDRFGPLDPLPAATPQGLRRLLEMEAGHDGAGPAGGAAPL
jgi:transcriptional regulator with XRE-family HTH domain